MFIFEADYAVHEGGTKYYQVFNIIDDISGDGVVVTHWGSYTRGAPRVPKLHGKGLKVDVYKRHASTSNSARIIREKTRRGYENWDKSKSSFVGFDDTKLSLEQWFKPGDVTLIMAQLTGHADEPQLSGASADFIIVDEFATMPTEAEIQALMDKEKELKMQNKNWGTW